MAFIQLSSEVVATLTNSIYSTNNLVFWQGPDAIDSGNAKLLMIFVGISAFALLAVAVVVITLAVIVFKLQKRLMQIVEEVKVKAMPIIDKTNGIVGDIRPKINEIAEKTSGIVSDLRPRITTIFDDLTPKIKGVTDNVHHVSNVIREKIDDFEPTITAANKTVWDANAKTQAQINRVDGMISSALTATSTLGTTIHDGIRAPIREAARGMSALRQKFDEVVKKIEQVRSGAIGRRGTKTASSGTRPASGYSSRTAGPSATAANTGRDIEFASVAAGHRDASLDTL